MLELVMVRQIHAPVKVVWDVLDDYGEIQRWSPGVKRSGLTAPGPVGVGTVRFCDFKPMGRALERIDAYEPYRRMAISLIETSLVPLSNVTVDFSLAPHEAGTRLTVTYAGMPNVLGRLLAGMFRKQMLRGLDGIVTGLQRESQRAAMA
jgi:carbon monoxide dehydrogenase subunit G